VRSLLKRIGHHNNYYGTIYENLNWPAIRSSRSFRVVSEPLTFGLGSDTYQISRQQKSCLSTDRMGLFYNLTDLLAATSALRRQRLLNSKHKLQEERAATNCKNQFQKRTVRQWRRSLIVRRSRWLGTRLLNELRRENHLSRDWRWIFFLTPLWPPQLLYPYPF